MREGAAMKKLLPWIIAAALLLAFVFLFASALPSHNGRGSRKYARQWRKQLLACQSLDEVKQHFNCFMIGEGPHPDEMERVAGQPWALIKSFPDGRWIACAHEDSHCYRLPGSGTIVTRDSSGEVHIFFGHVCGVLYAKGETLEEFYASLREYCRYRMINEVFLK